MSVAVSACTKLRNVEVLQGHLPGNLEGELSRASAGCSWDGFTPALSGLGEPSLRQRRLNSSTCIFPFACRREMLGKQRFLYAMLPG